MNSKHFNVKLIVATPIHIGNNEHYTPTDYDIDGNEFHVIDQKKFLKKITSDKILYNDFIKNCENFASGDARLLDFIRKEAKDLYKYSVKIDEKAKDYITRNPNEISRAPIDKFTRNNLDDTVYIPGSTIKGAIRSSIIEVIFRKLLGHENNLCEQESENRKKTIQAINKGTWVNIERLLNSNLSSNASDVAEDILKYILVSDFFPVSAEVKICYPVNKASDKENKIPQENKIPALLECIMPESVFEGTIDIKKEFFKNFNTLLENIKQTIKQEIPDLPEKDITEDFESFNSEKLTQWIKAYYKDKVYICESSKNPSNKIFNQDLLSKNCFIKLGKHAGAVSKTIAGLRKITVKGKSEPQPSQGSFWYIDNKPMGWVKVEFS